MTAVARRESLGRTVGDVGEKRLIRDVIAPLVGEPRDGLGLGDDAAVLEIPHGHSLVVSTDKIPEDLLALRFGLMDAYRHGRYLAEVTLSDIGAMGGRPIGLLATLALPNDFEVRRLQDVMQGFVDAGRRHDAPVVGGDTGWGSAVCLAATAVGVVETGRVLTRSGGSPGDALFVSGVVGGFGAALVYFANALHDSRRLTPQEEAWLTKRLIEPTARIDLGRALSGGDGCTACMDITDGLGQAVRELCEASGTGAEIDLGALPIHPTVHAVARLLELDIADLVFGIGLDLELLVALRSFPLPPPGLTRIGHATKGPELVVVAAGERRELPAGGWQHFAGDAMEIVDRAARPPRS